MLKKIFAKAFSTVRAVGKVTVFCAGLAVVVGLTFGAASLAGANQHKANSLKRTVVVSPVGSATDNGTALRNALNGITDASSTNPYLIKIEPGVYDLGGSQLQMKPWVDIEGSGEEITTLTATSASDSTLRGADNTELRFLTVRNTGGGAFSAVAIRGDANPFYLTHVTAIASSGSGTNVGVVIDERGVATLDDVFAYGSGGSNYGVYNFGSDTEIRNSRIVGGTATIGSGDVTVLVGASKLEGGPTTGAVTCAGVYDENYTFFANTCPS